MTGRCFVWRLAILALTVIAVATPPALATGDLYVSDILANTIVRVSPDGQHRSVFSPLLGPLGLTFDGAGNLYAASNSGVIDKFSPGGTAVAEIRMGLPVGLAFDSTGNLFAADYGARAIYQMDTALTSTTLFATAGLYLPYGLAYNHAGDMILADEGTGWVYKYDPHGQHTNPITYYGPIFQPCAVAVDADDNILVASFNDRQYNAGQIMKIAPDGGMTTLISGLWGPNGIALDSAGDLYIAQYYAGNIVKYAPDGTFLGTFAEGFSGPTFLAFGPESTAVPEPLTLAAVGMGVAGLGGYIRRRRSEAK